MTVEFVTKAEAYAQLRLDSAADDAWLNIFIPAVSGAVLAWLKEDWRAYDPELDANGDPVIDSAGDEVPAVDSDGDMTPRAVVKAAVLVELASQYRFRDGSGKDNVVPDAAGHGYILSKGATAILSGLRKSTVR
jgi:hypothetical protein